MADWAIFLLDSGQQFVPERDLIEHTLRLDCVCGPKLRGYICNEAHLHTQVMHQALDGRE